jgi:hypothetical protein
VSITVAKFLDVADGTQPGQFTIGDRQPVATLADLDPVYRRLLDEPVTAIIAVTGADGQPNLTPVWFDYDGDIVLLNLATHRKKVGWLRRTPYATYVLMNPENGLSLAEHQDQGEAGDLRGRPGGGAARHRPARQDLGEVHAERPALRAARSLDR